MSESAVRAVMDAYEDAAREADVDAYVRLFDDDLFWGPANREPVRSVPALRETIGTMFDNFEVHPDFAIEHVDVVGDLAAVVVHEDGHVTPNGGTPIRTNLTELFVLRRSNDAWRITRQIWNSRSAPS